MGKYFWFVSPRNTGWTAYVIHPDILLSKTL